MCPSPQTSGGWWFHRLPSLRFELDGGAMSFNPLHAGVNPALQVRKLRGVILPCGAHSAGLQLLQTGSFRQQKCILSWPGG
jgi:hypothetical protein